MNDSCWWLDLFVAMVDSAFPIKVELNILGSLEHLFVFAFDREK